MSKASDAGKLFLSGVLAKITDPDQRAQVEAALTSSEDALVVLGSGALGQAEISRRFNEIDEKAALVQADYDRLTAWHAEIKPKVDEYDRIKPEYDRLKTGAPNPNPNPAPPAKDVLDRETFDKEMRQQQIAAANYLGLQNAITLKHYQDFNEVIDTRDLLNDPKLGSQLPDGRTYGLINAYETKYGEKLTAKAAETEKARIDKLVNDQIAERMKTAPGIPYPNKADSGSPLDGFDPVAKPTAPPVSVADQAAAEYARLQQARG